MNTALPLLAVGPMLVAGVLIATRPSRPVRRVVLLSSLTAMLLTSVLLLAQVRNGDVLTERFGGWKAPFAISFAVDPFAALMLVLTSALTLLVCWFAATTEAADEPFFTPLVLLIAAGVNGAVMTSDLFNLFVFIEIMLLPSYGLIILAHRGRGALMQVTASRIYVTVNLLTSAVLLIGIALVYSFLGSVNYAAIAGQGNSSTGATLGCSIILIALGIKAAIVPAHGWLGRTYPHLSPTTTALFSSLHTKVAVYAIFRLYSYLFTDHGLGVLVTFVFCVSMVVGVLAAIGEKDARAILSFHMVSQIGYILLGLALFTPAGIAAGVFYLVHNVIAKASLFLSVGAIETYYGRHPIGKITGLLLREPVAALTFLAAAVSLAGLPPFAGFVAKLAIITATFEAHQWAAGAVALGVSLFTLLSMLKIWSGTFLGRPDPPLADNEGSRIPTRVIAPAVILAAAGLALGIAAMPLMNLSETIAHGLLHPQPYIEAVLGR